MPLALARKSKRDRFFFKRAKSKNKPLPDFVLFFFVYKQNQQTADFVVLWPLCHCQGIEGQSTG